MARKVKLYTINVAVYSMLGFNVIHHNLESTDSSADCHVSDPRILNVHNLSRHGTS
jgi:hypothetical protein